MDQSLISKRKKEVVRRILQLNDEVWRRVVHGFILLFILYNMYLVHRRRRRTPTLLMQPPPHESTFMRNLARDSQLYRQIFRDDESCVAHLRMDRHTFFVLCNLLRTFGGLTDSRHARLEEMTALFLCIIGHHKKFSTMKKMFVRSSATVSRHVHLVLNGVIHLHALLFRTPLAVTDECAGRWKCFKGCLGALDGTFVSVRVPSRDKPRYRTRKANIATNVLGVCNQHGFFTYVLAGWEGSAADSRVLRDSIYRPNGLHVPRGFYYLVDAGYPNSEGFLAPYRGQRYHLTEWNTGPQPTTPQEFFNMKHSKARNVIECAFGYIKNKFAILRSPCFYPVKTQNRIILVCCLLTNLIRREMPSERELLLLDDSSDDDDYDEPQAIPVGYEEPHGERIRYIDSSDQWAQWRNDKAQAMFNEWMASRGH